MPTIVAIHIAPGSRLEMKNVQSVEAEAGKGLIGDRYHGTRHRHVSIQSVECLESASEKLGSEIKPETTRRNITVTNATIPKQPGSRISIGEVELEVVRIAAPCRLLDDVIGPGAARALSGKAGSICRVLHGGIISVADAVIIAPPLDTEP